MKQGCFDGVNRIFLRKNANDTRLYNIDVAHSEPESGEFKPDIPQNAVQKGRTGGEIKDNSPDSCQKLQQNIIGYLDAKAYVPDSSVCINDFNFYEPDPANPKPAYKRTDRHILTYDKNAHTITEKQYEGKKIYSFEEYDEVVQERKQISEK